MRALIALFLIAAAPAQELSISFEPGGDGVHALAPDSAVVELGAVRNPGAPSAVRSSTVRLRILSRNAAVRTARLSAVLDAVDPHCRIRVDGILLGAAPQLIDARTPIGSPVAHTVQIEVAAAAPAGALQSSITWIASTD